MTRDEMESRSIPEPNTGCWLWLRAPRRPGASHGAVQYNGRTEYAHRVMFTLTHGPIPSGMVVCHRCDVGACINPDHLFLGTQAENMADMTAKGRRFIPTSEEGSGAELSVADVAVIRTRLAAGEKPARIATDFGVHRTTINRIKLGATWAREEG